MGVITAEPSYHAQVWEYPPPSMCLVIHTFIAMTGLAKPSPNTETPADTHTHIHTPT